MRRARSAEDALFAHTIGAWLATGIETLGGLCRRAHVGFYTARRAIYEGSSLSEPAMIALAQAALDITNEKVP